MKLPLVVYGLLFMVLMLAYAFVQRGKQKRPKPAWDGNPGAATGQAMAEMLTDNLRVLVLLAGAALLDIAFGKPELVQQYAAWAVVGGQVLKSLAIWSEKPVVVLVLRVAVLACLAYLWILQLPFFDPLPP